MLRPSKRRSSLEPGSEEPRCWWASVKAIAENDYNLAAGRYKPQIAEKAPDEDPAELIRETLAIEREITEGLEKLLREVEE
jgi:type I restriction enzyme M protein